MTLRWLSMMVTNSTTRNVGRSRPSASKLASAVVRESSAIGDTQRNRNIYKPNPREFLG